MKLYSKLIIKADKRLKRINIFEHTCLYSAQADDSNFFLRDKRSIKELINTFATFSKYSCLKPSRGKCEINAEKCESGSLWQEVY